MLHDPVCAMPVSEEVAKAKSVYRGVTYYFCSTLCKQLFDREPEKYIAAKPDHPAKAEGQP